MAFTCACGNSFVAKMGTPTDTVIKLLHNKEIYFCPFHVRDGHIYNCGSDNYDGIWTWVERDVWTRKVKKEYLTGQYYPTKDIVETETATPFSPIGKYYKLNEHEAYALAEILNTKRGFCAEPMLAAYRWCFWKNHESRQLLIDINEEEKSIREVKERLEGAARAERDNMKYFDGEWYHEDQF